MASQLTPSPGFAGSSPLGEQFALLIPPPRGRWRAQRDGGGQRRFSCPFTGLGPKTHRLGQDRRAREKGFQLALGLV